MNTLEPEYDVVVIGSGLGGLTGANQLGKWGRKVLLLEQHSQYGGLATWFKRPGGHIFDVSLHGFPHQMIKSCRKYWSKKIADSIMQLPVVRFENPQFKVSTTFAEEDLKRVLVEQFRLAPEQVDHFYKTVRGMEFFHDQTMTTRELFDQLFPGRDDVVRMLMESITYANGSTLNEPAITYGIVFCNFLSKGVFTFQGGTDKLIDEMKSELDRNGVQYRNRCRVEKIIVEKGRVAGVIAGGRKIGCRAVFSNGNLRKTILDLTGEEYFPKSYIDDVKHVQMSTSSCQVYLGIREGEDVPDVGDLLFISDNPVYDYRELTAMDTSSRTFSFYYPKTRPGHNRYTIVGSSNARWDDWADLPDEDYRSAKEQRIERTIAALERYIPDVREKINHREAATPRTFARYTGHENGASFGTKFEGLKVSQSLPEQVGGLFHAGSVGIIMSGWLGALNYGVIAAHNLDQYLDSLIGKSQGKETP